MIDQPPPLPTPDQAAIAKPSEARRLALAFQSVFGQAVRTGRTADQRLVLRHLRKVCCADALVFQTHPQTGAMDPIAAAQRDGARSVILIVERWLARARKTDAEETGERKKPKTIR